MTALSVLDLMMIGEGKTFAHTLAEASTLAQHVERHTLTQVIYEIAAESIADLLDLLDLD